MTDGLSEAYEIKQWDVFTENNELLLENDQLKAENAKLRKLVQRIWPVFIGEKRATFADRLHVRAEIDELGVEVGKP